MQRPAVFDPELYKQSTRRQWDSAARAWNDWSPVIERWLGAVTDTMLDAAHVGRGARVLDVAAGAGEQSLRIARRVGPQGSVLASDLSPEILAFAAANARREGLENVQTRVLDAEDLRLDGIGFDAAVSRLGLMYVPSPAKALSGMRAALRPGGRVAVIVVSTPERNPWMAIPASIIRNRGHVQAPAPGQPGPFSLGGAGVIERAFREAGFARCEVQAVAAPLELDSADECLAFERESFGALHEMLSSLSDAEKEETWREVLEALRPNEGESGFALTGEMLVAAATA